MDIRYSNNPRALAPNGPSVDLLVDVGTLADAFAYPGDLLAYLLDTQDVGSCDGLYPLTASWRALFIMEGGRIDAMAYRRYQDLSVQFAAGLLCDSPGRSGDGTTLPPICFSRRLRFTGLDTGRLTPNRRAMPTDGAAGSPYLKTVFRAWAVMTAVFDMCAGDVCIVFGQFRTRSIDPADMSDNQNALTQVARDVAQTMGVDADDPAVWADRTAQETLVRATRRVRDNPGVYPPGLTPWWKLDARDGIRLLDIWTPALEADVFSQSKSRGLDSWSRARRRAVGLWCPGE